MKKTLILIIISLFLISACTIKNYECPNIEDLDYDETTDTYIQWVNCMPGPDSPTQDCEGDEEYEAWVTENCGFKFDIRGAY